MKKWLSIAAVMVLCLALVIGIACGGEEDEEGVKEVKFGFGAPMSGTAGAVAGIPLKWAVELYQDWHPTFEVAGQTYEWDFIFEDSMPGGVVSVAGGHAATTKLIYERGVRFLWVAPIEAALAAMMITEELDEPAILTIGYGGMFDVGPDVPHSFCCMCINDMELLPFFDWLSKEHPEVKRVVCTTAASRTSEVMYDGNKAACDYYGLELKSVETPEFVVEYYPIATKIMAYNPDLVLGSLELFKAMWDMGYEGLCATGFWSQAGYGAVPWDKAAGKTFIFMPHPMQEPWPEVAAFAREYEDRFGIEVTPGILWAMLVGDIMSQAFEIAGTVDDTEKIVEALGTGIFDTVMGPVYFGGEDIIGLPRLMMMPQPIWEIAGPGQYEVVAEYTAEELEALVSEIYAGR